MSDEQLAALEEQKKNCIFCKLISKEIPGISPYEDEEIIAFMDIRPATKGHILVMPKDHYPILPIIPQDKLIKLFAAVKKLVGAVQIASLTKKSSIFVANGGAAGQLSPHFILHIIPREDGDMLPLNPVSLEASEQESKSITQALSSRFKPADQPETVQERDPVSDLAAALEQNPEVREMIKKNPEKFKDYVKTSPQLEALFQHINIETLSAQLKKMDENKSSEPAASKSEHSEPEEETKKSSDSTDSEKSAENDASEQDTGGADLDKISNLFK